MYIVHWTIETEVKFLQLSVDMCRRSGDFCLSGGYQIKLNQRLQLIVQGMRLIQMLHLVLVMFGLYTNSVKRWQVKKGC